MDRFTLLQRQDGRCFYCECYMAIDRHRGHSVTRDHKQPRVRGGSNAGANIVGACRRCNQLKGRLTEEEFRSAFLTPADIEAAIPIKAFDLTIRRGARRARRTADRLRLGAVDFEKIAEANIAAVRAKFYGTSDECAHQAQAAGVEVRAER